MQEVLSVVSYFMENIVVLASYVLGMLILFICLLMISYLFSLEDMKKFCKFVIFLSIVILIGMTSFWVGYKYDLFEIMKALK